VLPESSPVLPLSVELPPSVGGGGGGGGGGGAEHDPCSEPGGLTQVFPAQQSAFDVHAPVVGMHCVLAQTSCPEESGTHGVPSQQSAAVEQVLPFWRQVFVPASVPPR
jgi:hypothetical protein